MSSETLQQQFEQATALHREGRLVDAERLYRQILRTRPDHVEARHLLGILRFQQGRSSEALDQIAAALKITPDYPEALYNRGNILSQLERYHEAIASYDQALALSANYVEAYHNRGNALFKLRRYEDALASHDEALALAPGYVEALNSRGAALNELGRCDEALASFDQALTIRPNAAEALCNRGKVLLELNRHDDALASYDRALAVLPDSVEALNGRGNVLSALMQHEEALAHYERALAIKPDDADALSNRGGALQGLDRHEDALASYERALAIEPGHVEALLQRGNLLREMNRLEEAVASYDRALVEKPEFAAAKFAAVMAQLPVVYRDEAEIAARRAAYRQRLGALSAEADSGGARDLIKGVGSSQPFYLAYQGMNDHDLQARYGALMCRIMAEQYPPAAMPEPPRPDEPVRVGIVSGFFRQHSNWKIPIKGWVSQLDRRRFRIFGYHTGIQYDGETEAARAWCERFVQGPLSLDSWRNTILADRPHVLIYPEVGMNPVAARLAAQRLALVQCNSWGHPDTSGFPTLDYYLSSDLMEPPDGQEHYTEQLVRLPNLSIYYEALDVAPAEVGRTELGLRADATVFWCGQSLYKYLPQYDSVFARIALAAPDCQFAFIQHPKGTNVTELFRWRLDRAFTAVGLSAEDHCVFLSRLDHAKFVAAIGQADIFLDSIGWSGCNSTLEALPHDLPVVTMTGDLMRGRHGAAILAMMGVTETVAETVDGYVCIAVRLARDIEWRMAMKRRITAAKHRVYRDRSCISALEEFLIGVVRAPGCEAPRSSER